MIAVSPLLLLTFNEQAKPIGAACSFFSAVYR
jgi:hypothetical protein